MSLSIKHILLSNNNWWDFYNNNQKRIRDDILSCIVKLLSCKNTIRGYRAYCCSNKDCSHTKIIPHTCKSRACSSCGKKLTEMWISKQQEVLPNTSWQHITFTMPSELWDFFWYNRYLFNKIGKIAANCITTLAKNVIPGIFIAIHSFGRDLKRNVHVHLSTTTGGLTKNLKSWKKLYFIQHTLMKIWRYQIIKMFRKSYQDGNLKVPNSIRKTLNNSFNFHELLNSLYKKRWIVHCAKPTKNHKKNVGYLGRYIKRPPIAESRLKHYDGNTVTLNYLDHTASKHKLITLEHKEFIARFISHIPDKGFRLIRYYGFLANRVRGKLLPIVYNLIGQRKNECKPTPSFASMFENNFGFNPLKCILCGSMLILEKIVFGNCKVEYLIKNHKELSVAKNL